MSCYTDFKNVLSNNYIDSLSLENLATNNIAAEIKVLTDRLQKLKDLNPDVIETALGILSELSFFKMALETKVTANKIPDIKVPKRVYIQLRGAVSYAKGKRVWVSQYVGKIEDVYDENGKILQKPYRKAREAVVLKLVKGLKEAE
jgi:hypothetical protein